MIAKKRSGCFGLFQYKNNEHFNVSFSFFSDYKTYGITVYSDNERVTAREFEGIVCLFYTHTTDTDTDTHVCMCVLRKIFTVY